MGLLFEFTFFAMAKPQLSMQPAKLHHIQGEINHFIHKLCRIKVAVIKFILPK